jgi:hypothetical protein
MIRGVRRRHLQESKVDVDKEFGMPWHQLTVPKICMILDHYHVRHPKRPEKHNIVAMLHEHWNTQMVRKDHNIIRAFFLVTTTRSHIKSQYASFSDYMEGKRKSVIVSGRGKLEVKEEVKDTKSCVVCLEDYEVDEFSESSCSEACDHKVEICKGCVTLHINSQIIENPTKINCPVCPESVGFKCVKLYASAEAFER